MQPFDHPRFVGSVPGIGGGVAGVRRLQRERPIIRNIIGKSNEPTAYPTKSEISVSLVPLAMAVALGVNRIND